MREPTDGFRETHEQYIDRMKQLFPEPPNLAAKVAKVSAELEPLQAHVSALGERVSKLESSAQRQQVVDHQFLSHKDLQSKLSSAMAEADASAEPKALEDGSQERALKEALQDLEYARNKVDHLVLIKDEALSRVEAVSAELEASKAARQKLEDQAVQLEAQREDLAALAAKRLRVIITRDNVIGRLEGEAERKGRKISSLQKFLQEAEAQREEAQSKAWALNRQLEALKYENQVLDTAALERLKKIDELQDEAEKREVGRQDKIKDLEREVGRRLEEINDLRRANEALSDAQALNDRLKVAESEIADFEALATTRLAKIQKLETKAEDLDTALKTSRALATQFEALALKRFQRIQELEKEAETKIDCLREEMEEMEEDHRNTMRERDEALAEVERLRGVPSTGVKAEPGEHQQSGPSDLPDRVGAFLEAKIERLQGEVDQAKKERDEARDEAGRLRSELASGKKDNTSELLDLAGEVCNVLGERDRARSDVRELRSQVERFKTRLEAAVKDRGELIASCQKLQTQMLKTTKDLKDAHREVSRLLGLISGMAVEACKPKKRDEAKPTLNFDEIGKMVVGHLDAMIEEEKESGQ